ncbi:hypothetical protein LDFHOB_00410 [Candidatus Electronema aureum]
MLNNFWQQGSCQFDAHARRFFGYGSKLLSKLHISFYFRKLRQLSGQRFKFLEMRFQLDFINGICTFEFNLKAFQFMAEFVQLVFRSGVIGAGFCRMIVMAAFDFFDQLDNFSMFAIFPAGRP